MHSDSGRPSENPRRHLHGLILRMGVGVVLLAILALSAASFALFGCSCDRSAQMEPKLIPLQAEEPPAKLGAPVAPQPSQ